MVSPNETRILTEKYKGLEYLNLPVALVDMSFNLLHFNSTFTRLIQSLNDVFPAKDFEQIFESFSAKVDGLRQIGLHAGYLQNFVIPQVKIKGIDRFFDLHVSKLNPEQDHLEGFTVTCVETTDKVKEIQKYKELSEHHLKFLEYTTSGVIIHQNGKIIYSNQQADKLVGLNDGQTLLGHLVWEFVTEEFKTVVAARLKFMNEFGGPVAVIEEKITRVDNTTFYAEVFAYPVTAYGQPAIKTIINDITERKNADVKLRESQKQYVALVENLNDVVFQTDTKANFTFLNNSWENLSGYKIDETIGKSCFEFLQHPTNTESFYTKVRKLVSSGLDDFEYELLLKLKNNEFKYVQVKLSPVYNENNIITGISGMINNIHSKKLAELEIKNIQEKLKKQQHILMSLAKDESIINGDFDNALHTIAKIAAETLAVSRVNIWQFENEFNKLGCLVNYDNDKKQFTGCVSFTKDQFPNYFHLLINERIIVVEDSIKDPREVEFRDIYHLPLGITSNMDITIYGNKGIWGVLSFDHKGPKRKWSFEDQTFARSICDFIMLAFEASSKKFTQQQLSKKEEVYRNLVEQASDAIFIVDQHDKFVEVNEKMVSITGYNREELLALNVKDLIPERFLKDGVLASDEARKVQHYLRERIYLTKGREEKIAEISAVLLPDGRIQGIARDITDRKKQEQALTDSETRLDMALKGADLGTWDFFIKENQLIHNKRWAEMLGYNFEITVVNEQFWDKFVHPEDIDTAYDAFEKHIKGETPFYETTIRMLASNGEWRWIQDKGKVVEWDEDGNAVRASGIHQDVTALKLYEQEIQQQRVFLQEIINAIPNPIYVKNANDEFVVVNDALAEFLGTDVNSLLQYRYSQQKYFNHKLNVLFDKDYEVFISRKPLMIHEHEIENDIAENTQWLQTIKVPLKDAEGNFTEILSISTDITDIKNKEKLLAELNDKLEIKVSERTNMLEYANKELETFNYSVSHDLRTPLRTIDIFAYFLEKNYKQSLDTEGLQNLKQIRLSVSKMSGLIDNLLIFSKMGRAVTRLSIIKTEDLVREILDEISTTQDTSNVLFTIPNMPSIRGDYQMIKQAFHNLISNAVKFSGAKRKPIIEFFGMREDETTTIAFRDNGVGFSMDYKDKLFKAFKRLHSDERFEGTGVGLAIVEKIIKRHNGQIWAESEENKGTTFYIKLPN